ncbi:hypothetical protein FQA39_LY12910 [Lamprigera yunnana]|nr:hypothetical protein FQA39_LY12910 [Lamprigera yunnana]
MAQNIILNNNDLMPKDQITKLDPNNQVISLDYSTSYQIRTLDIKPQIKNVMGSSTPSEMDINPSLLEPKEGIKELSGNNKIVDLLGVITSGANLLLGKDFNQKQADFIVTTIKSLNQILRSLLVPTNDISSMQNLVDTIDNIASTINSSLSEINSFQDFLGMNIKDDEEQTTFGGYATKISSKLSTDIINLVSPSAKTNMFFNYSSNFPIDEINDKEHIFSSEKTNLEISKNYLKQRIDTFSSFEILSANDDSKGYSIQRITASLFSITKEKGPFKPVVLTSPVSLLLDSLLKEPNMQSVLAELLGSIKISSLINLAGPDIIHSLQFLYGIQDLTLLDILNIFNNHFAPGGYNFDFDTIIELLKNLTSTKFTISGGVTTTTTLSSLIVALVANDNDGLTLTNKDNNGTKSATKDKENLLETIFMGNLDKNLDNPFEKGTIAYALSKIYGHYGTKEEFDSAQNSTVVKTFKGLSDLLIYLKGPATQKYVDDYIVGYFDQNL